MIFHRSRSERRDGRRSRGTAMLETALVLPVILLLALGTMEFGMLFARYQILLHSARAGAREASLYRENCNPRAVKGDVDNAVMANGSQLGMLLLPTNVEVTGACSPVNVRVRVHYDHYFTLVRGFLGDVSVPLSVTIVMRNES